MRANLKLALLFASLIVVDQLSKFLVLKYFNSISVLNIDGGFSMSSGNINFGYISLTCLAIFVTLIAIYFKSAIKTSAFVFIIAGTISNLIDRVARGGVVDFLDIKIWPSFNLADSCIVIGAALLIIRELRTKDTD